MYITRVLVILTRNKTKRLEEESFFVKRVSCTTESRSTNLNLKKPGYSYFKWMLQYKPCNRITWINETLFQPLVKSFKWLVLKDEQKWFAFINFKPYGNIVGCNLLHSFGHPVAMSSALLAQFWPFSNQQHATCYNLLH